MVIYSMSQEDTIKIALKFPSHVQLDHFYDYKFRVQDLHGRAVL